MNRLQRSLTHLLILAAVASCFIVTTAATAGQYYRQRYSSWNYHPTRTYYYTRYTYHPVVATTTTTYSYHYAIHYPRQPRYVYYYNPTKQVYWGRYDIQDAGYSLLKKEDRKKDLEDIPESAFPKPGKMPPIPESNDGESMLKPDLSKLPKAEVPADAP